MPGPADIRDAITALEARRTELEALIAEDLERRFFSDRDEIVDTVTNPIAGTDTEVAAANTRCASHFTMTWFAVPTS